MTTLLHLLVNPRNFDRLLGRQTGAFRSFGYNVVTASAPGQRSKAFANSPTAHHSLTAVSDDSDILADIRAVSQIRGLLAEVKPDIVHTHDAKMAMALRILCKRAEVPIVVNTVYDTAGQGMQTLARRVAKSRLDRAAASHSDAEFVRDSDGAEALRSLGVPDERIHLIGSGVDLEFFAPNRATARAGRCLRLQLGISLRSMVVTVVGDLLWDEGYGEFFDAVEILRRRFRVDQVSFVVVGNTRNGPHSIDAETLERMTEEHGVHFIDDGKDESSILAMTDVCVVPTHRPTFPRVAMAASAMSVPVVATDLPGCRSVIDHQQTGLLVRPHKPQHLALTIERLLLTASLRSELGRAGRARAVVDFDERRVLDRTRRVYEQLLARNGLPIPEEVIEPDEPWYLDSIDLVDRESEAERNAEIELRETGT